MKWLLSSTMYYHIFIQRQKLCYYPSTMRKTVVFFFHLIFLLVPLFFTAANDELFEFNKIILTYILTMFILGAWIIRMILEKKLLWKKTPFDIPIAIFYISQLLSTIFSISQHTSVFGYYSRFNGGLLSISAYIVLYYAFVNNVKRIEVKSLLGTLFLGATLSAFYAFLEHFGHSISCLLITRNFDVSCWVQDVQSRVFGTFGQPNWLAAYLIMILPLAGTRLIELFSLPGIWRRVVFVVFIALYFSTLLFTGSRSGLLGLAIGVAGYAIYMFIGLYQHHSLYLQQKRKKSTEYALRPILYSATIGTVVCFGLIVIFGTPFTPKLSEIVGRLNQSASSSMQLPSPTPAPVQAGTQLDVGGSESGDIRKVVWRGAIQVWKRYPMFGSGVETFAYSYYKDRPMEHNALSEWDFLYNKAHNEFLNYLATTGTVGLGAYLLMIGWVYVWAFRHAHESPLTIAAWMAGYTALHVSNFFGFSTVVVSTLFYLLPAFLFVSSADNVQQELSSEFQKKSRHSTVPTQAWQWILCCGIGIATLYLVIVFVNMWRADVAYARGKQLLVANQGIEGLRELQNAIKISPTNEGVFHETLAKTAADLTLTAYQQNNATMAGQLGELAVTESNLMMASNPVNLNFYRSQAQVFITLSQVAPAFLKEALNTLDKAQDLAPTDPKLTYNRALVNEALGQKELAITLLKQALQMKPNYDGARDQLKRMEGVK